MNTQVQCRPAWFAVTVLALVAMGAAGASAAAAPKYSTPAQVVAAYEKAHDAGDDGAGIDCMSPGGQNKCLKFMVGMELATRQTEPGAPPPSAEEKKAQAETDALLAKHGIKDLAKRAGEEEEAYINRITAHVTDQRTLLIKMMQMMEGAVPGTKPAPCRKGEIKDLKITGDTATGKYVTKEEGDSTMSQDLKFKQIDGSWLLADVIMLSSTETSGPTDAAGVTATQPAKP